MKCDILYIPNLICNCAHSIPSNLLENIKVGLVRKYDPEYIRSGFKTAGSNADLKTQM